MSALYSYNATRSPAFVIMSRDILVKFSYKVVKYYEDALKYVADETIYMFKIPFRM